MDSENFIVMKDYLASINFRDTIDEIRSARDRKKMQNLLRFIRKDIKKGKISINRGHYLLGYIELRCGNLDKATEYLTRSYHNSENRYLTADILLSFGYINFMQENYEEAKKYCYAALDVVDYNRKAETFSLLAKIAISQGSNADALKYYEQGYLATKCGYLLSEMAWLYLREENYEKVLELLLRCKDSPDIKDDFDVRRCLLFLCEKLNIFVDNCDFSSVLNTYTGKQIVEYDFNLALEHISKHLVDNKVIDEDREDLDAFNENVDLYLLMLEVESMLDDKYRVISTFRDVYVIPYNGIGSNGSDFIKVVTIPNSKQILTMYPVYGKYNIQSEYKKVKNKK